MAWVRTFRIDPYYGAPDKNIQEWITQCEQNAIVSVQTRYIPSSGKTDGRITVIVTKLDDIHAEQKSN